MSSTAHSHISTTGPCNAHHLKPPFKSHTSRRYIASPPSLSAEGYALLSSSMLQTSMTTSSVCQSRSKQQTSHLSRSKRPPTSARRKATPLSRPSLHQAPTPATRTVSAETNKTTPPPLPGVFGKQSCRSTATRLGAVCGCPQSGRGQPASQLSCAAQSRMRGRPSGACGWRTWVPGAIRDKDKVEERLAP